MKPFGGNIPTDEQMQELADFYTVFSDVTRVKLLYSLLEGEKRVSEISETVGISQSATSHQLRFLKEKALWAIVAQVRAFIIA